MYLGAALFNDFKTKSNIFKSILKEAGSQWKEARTGVMCSCLQVPVKRRVAVFWTNRKHTREQMSVSRGTKRSHRTQILIRQKMNLSNQLFSP